MCLREDAQREEVKPVGNLLQDHVSAMDREVSVFAWHLFLSFYVMLSSNDSNPFSYFFVPKSMSFLRSSVTWDRAQCVAIMSATSRRTNSE